jgi:hypothetical protein
MKNTIRMNGIIFSSACLLAMLLFMAVKCKHKEDFIGTEYKLAASDFQVLPPVSPALKSFYMTVPPLSSRTAVNFSATKRDTIRFYANFSQRVTWFIDLRGITSGAKKRFTGLTQELQTEKDLYWTGTADDLIMFNSGEKVEATLSFMGTALTLKDTITIQTKRSYSNVVRLVNDFESVTVVGDGKFPAGGPPYWYTFFDGADKIYDGVAGDKTIFTVDQRIPNGSRFYLFEGTDINKSFYIEGAGFDQSPKIPIATANPDSLYFNVYVYGFGLANTKFQVGFDEDDNMSGVWGDGPKDLTKYPGEVSSDTEDEYDYAVQVDWIGWRLISFKYSDANLILGLSPNGSHGNHIKEPWKVQKMSFVMNTSTLGGHAKVAFDYPIFTYGAPFDPNK